MEMVINNKWDYPPREGYRGAGFGYASDMMHLAVNRDDAEGFMKYLGMAGGLECEVLLAGSLENYAALHGATNCIKALFAAGKKSDEPMAYWLKKAEKPNYGPRANRQPEPM